jgi:hypothetical protein
MTLLTRAKVRNQPRCPLTDDWIKKMWYTCPMEYYSAIKKNQILSFAAKWKEPESIALSKISQTQKNKHHIFSLKCRSSEQLI